MEIVTAREFRSHLGKFLTAARAGSPVVLSSRYGRFRLVPLDDAEATIEQDLRAACAEVKAHMEGKTELPLAKDVVF